MSQMRTFLRQLNLPLLALTLTAASLLTAGPLARAEAGSRFAAPDGRDQGAVSVIGDAKGGNGGGKGGNGGKGGKGGGGNDGETALEMQVQPGTWNTNWSRSNGTVSVKITGSGLGDVDLDSIVLIGTVAEAEPLSALRARHNGNHIRVYFAKSEVLEILDTPKAGETHTITLRLTAATAATAEGSAESELTDSIRIVGPAK